MPYRGSNRSGMHSFQPNKSRIIGLLVERVDVRNDRVDIKLQIAGITSLVGELTGNSVTLQDAA